MTTQTPDAVREAVILAQAREAAAQAFDARAKKAGHPATVTMERHHAKVIRQGEGDDYDAVQSALIALRLAALDSGADHDRSIYEQGRRDACEDHDIALDSRAGDAGKVLVEVLDKIASLATPAGNVWTGSEPLWQTEIAALAENAVQAYDAATPAPAVDAGEEAEHIRQTEMQEIADGAYGDGPATRGAARDYLAAPAVDAVPAGEVDWIAKAAERMASIAAIPDAMIDAALNARVPGGAPVLAWLPMEDGWTPSETARDIIRHALFAALSHGEGRK